MSKVVYTICLEKMQFSGNWSSCTLACHNTYQRLLCDKHRLILMQTDVNIKTKLFNAIYDSKQNSIYIEAIKGMNRQLPRLY